MLAVERRRKHFHFERRRTAQTTVREVIAAVSPVFGRRFWVVTGSGYDGLSGA